ncbi:hypothetical protein Rctr197k_132 [Virus Rctr197k]|nr:hypothetical protein Rctr197k_132 [Virus Rctr197k]
MPDLTWTQYQVLSRLSSDFAPPSLTMRANTLYALEKLGFAESDGLRTDSATQKSWRRTEAGQTKLNHLIGSKAR